MSSLGKIFWSIVIVVLAGGAIASQFVTVRHEFIRQQKYSRNGGELVRDVLLGQTFRATANDLSAIGITFATYSNRSNNQDIHFHLRSSVNDQSDIRTGKVSASELRDKQAYRFEFEPISDSKGRDYFFFVVSPSSVPGNAVTVAFDDSDPYPQGSAFIVRGQGSAVTDPVILNRSGKQAADLAFNTFHTVPLRVAVVSQSIGRINNFINNWDNAKHSYSHWLRAFLPAIAFFGVLFCIRQKTYDRFIFFLGKTGLTITIFSLLIIAGGILRIIYADQLSVTNDEGNYLYDALMIRQGVLAGGDGYVKAPLVIAWLAFWQMIAGNTIMAGRLSSVVAGLLTAIPIYWLARDIFSSKAITSAWVPAYLSPESQEKTTSQTGWGRRIGLVAAAIWLLFGTGVVFNIYVHTQPVALLLGVSGLAILLMALRGNTPRFTFFTSSREFSAAGWFFTAGFLLGLGVASRKSILALGLIPLLLFITEGTSWRARWRNLLFTGLGFLLVITLLLGGAYLVYGLEGVWEALGFNSAEDGILSTDPAELDQVKAYSLRGMTPFFRESLPLILLSVIGLGVACEQLIRAGLTRIKYVSSRQAAFILDQIVPKLGWLPAWATFGWAWSFFVEYEGEAFMQWGIDWLWYCFAGILLLLTLIPRPRVEAIKWAGPAELVKVSTQPGKKDAQSAEIAAALQKKLSLARHFTAALTVPLWVGGLVFFYANWIKFHANYISEFIPPLTILGAYGAVALYQRLRPRLFFAHDYPIFELGRRAGIVLISLVILWSITVSNYITYLYEHTGTFDQRAAKEAAVWAREHIPISQPIFTGAALIPYLSGHRVALDIAHPRWYAYEFTRKDTGRINTFLPPAEAMLRAFRNSEWFLHEQQTGFSFMMEYTEVEAGLENDFVSIKGIENGSNTLTFYQRVR